MALTSVVIKCFIKAYSFPASDPFHFVYRQHRGVNDAVLKLLHGVYIHLEKPKSFVRLVFVDFNTVQPHLMG